jgi:branched-chain amino acid transport system permease protein
MLLALISPYVDSALTLAGIYAIAAVGLQVTIASGQFSIIHGALMGMGGYAAGVAAVKYHLSLALTMVVAAVIAAAVGAVVSAACLRLNWFLISIATLAIGEALSILFNNIHSLGGAFGYGGAPLRTSLPVVAATLAVVLFVAARVRRSRVGLGLVAVGQDEVAAASLGISPISTKIWAFALGGAAAGCAGALNVQWLSLVTPKDLGFQFEVQLLFFVVIGGMSTAWGALAGAVIFTLVPELLRFATLDRYWILGLVLLATILVRPQGILTRRPVERRPWGLGWLATLRHPPPSPAPDPLPEVDPAN